MSNERVVILGCGALGSNLVEAVRNLPVIITVVDDDRVEQKNVQSQFHTLLTVGRNKAVAMQQTMKYLFNRGVFATPHRFTADNVEQILGNADLAIDCFDNAPSRQLAQDYARKKGLPLLHGALANDGSYAQVVWDEHFAIDDATPGTPTCENGEHLPFIGIVANYLAYVAQTYLTKWEKPSFHIHPGGAIRIA